MFSEDYFQGFRFFGPPVTVQVAPPTPPNTSAAAIVVVLITVVIRLDSVTELWRVEPHWGQLPSRVVLGVDFNFNFAP